MSDQVANTSVVAEQSQLRVAEVALPPPVSPSHPMLRRIAPLLFILVAGMLTVFESFRSRPLAVLLACAWLLQPGALPAAQVAVRHTEGVVHGFLALRTLEGNTLADGDLIQVARGDRVTSQLLFHFKDGTVHDERAVYSQRRSFQLLSYHLVQKGPAFQHPMEVSINGSTGQVTVRYSDGAGKQKVASDRLQLPPDVANGLILTLVKNVVPDAPRTTVSMVAATPKPRLVKLVVTPQGEEPFSIGGSKRRATHYVLKVEIGGVAGWVAPFLGMQPPDIHVWILSGDAPAFVKLEGPLYLGGPTWRVELTSPVWPAADSKNGTGGDKNKR